MKTVLTQYYPELRMKTLQVFDTTDKGYNKMIDRIDTIDAKIFSLDDEICQSTPHMCEQVALMTIQGSFVPVGRLARSITHPHPVAEHRITAAPCEVEPCNEAPDDDDDGELPEFTDRVLDENGVEVVDER